VLLRTSRARADALASRKRTARRAELGPSSHLRRGGAAFDAIDRRSGPGARSSRLLFVLARKAFLSKGWLATLWRPYQGPPGVVGMLYSWFRALLVACVVSGLGAGLPEVQARGADAGKSASSAKRQGGKASRPAATARAK